NRCSNAPSSSFLNSELAGMETTTLPSFLPASTASCHLSGEAPQLFWEKPKNRIAKAVTQTTILCRLYERATESPPSSLEWISIILTNLFFILSCRRLDRSSAHSSQNIYVTGRWSCRV